MTVTNLLKLTFIPGLKDVVIDELNKYPGLNLVEADTGEIYIEFISNFEKFKDLKSVLNIYIIREGRELNPHYISKHKSVLGGLIELVIDKPNNKFKTFRISCAGSESEEILKIQEYIEEKYKLNYSEDADMDIFIGKKDDLWEVGVRTTSRPLSLREYKIGNIKGGLNPTVAYSMNTFCELDSIDSYLNIFSGSATLLIEGREFSKKAKFIGFDVDKKTNSLAIQNVKKAGYIKSIEIKTADIFEKPDYGKFDAITSDLPFGMQISKGEDLKELYKSFIEYCEKVLNLKGKLVIYTSEYEVLDNVIKESQFNIIKTLSLKIPTSINAYLNTKVFVCEFK